ncbi:peptidoglycan-binding protein [Actinomadura macrotermitis]|uniref:Peptidoglycan binding-like domain-containing protein n=1 Tax=Actinomadura macrotermitis TaxID=2585200 RepID=A0A7K0BTG6_9ACTN|nr:peptidoglycan-binding protein [Actinomadura macrotermitis]MQY04480.1 hypothetical protein [Actinomadura macrotermitis]
MNRRRAVATGVTGVALIGVAGLATAGLGGGGGGTPAAGRSMLPPATAQVERTTLVESQKVSGTLGYGDTTTASGGGGQGVVTWLPAAGSVVTRGDTAYKVNNKPVPLLYGRLPLFRKLSDGAKGTDVLQFERNLSALGYGGFTVDKTYSSATAAAVKRWQEDLGLDETGEVKPGSVLIASGALRVAEHRASVGDRLGGALYTYTGTRRVVSVDLDVKYQRFARKGAEVTIDLPGGGTVKGRIARVGKVATKAKGSESTTIAVTVAVRGGSLGSYDKAPVDVHLTTARHADVLAVPVAALLARTDGGYAVQAVDNGRTRMVPVETGVFSSGKVEVSGQDVAEGMKVGVPA